MVLANLGNYKHKETPGMKTTLPAGTKRCIDSSNLNYLVASYDHAGMNGGCNYDASTLKRNPSAANGTRYQCLAFLHKMIV
jgi:hypothetical protein